MPSSHGTIKQELSDFALPLVIAVTGHRELLDNELEGIRNRVRELFEELQLAFPSRRLCIMSPLAEGADSLVAEIAIDLNLDLIVPLPKPVDSYLEDFRDDESRLQFKRLSEKAKRLIELPIEIPVCPTGVDSNSWKTDYPYAQLGVFLSSHCHILLALWDGNGSHHLGGTAQVVKFHQDNVMPGITRKTVSSQQMLIDDENDLVFHLVCTHGKQSAKPLSNFNALDWYWSSKDPQAPFSKIFPEQHAAIFKRAAEFSTDAQQFEKQILANGNSLIEDGGNTKLPAGSDDIDKLFGIADYLAIHFQKKALSALRLTHIMAFLMGFMFILFSDLDTWRIFLIAFVCFFAVASVAQWIAQRGAWHRKYLDYRTLAEGLRVQFYWNTAGVAPENQWTFTHDSFLQAQDPEIGWIRDVMRVAGIVSDAAIRQSSDTLHFTIDNWIGNTEKGQLGYYARVSKDRIRRHHFTKRLGLASLLSSVIIVVLFIAIGPSLSESMATSLLLTMGTLLLLFAVREGYAYATAIKELIKQYEFMFQVFENANRRLQLATDDGEKRQILFALGQTALNENADWILMHRERSVDRTEIWRMGS